MLISEIKQGAQRLASQVVIFFERQKKFAETRELIEKGLLVIGRHTYGLPKVWIYNGSESRVEIGDFCSIAPGVEIISGGIHPFSWVSTYPFRIHWKMAGAHRDGMPETKGDTIIGSDVWIGTDAMIFSGVSIGHGAIVAARSVVTRSVPPYAVVAGNPAREIKFRFEPHIVERLLKAAWWDWSDEKIRKAVPLLSSGKVEEFLNSYGPDGQVSA